MPKKPFEGGQKFWPIFSLGMYLYSLAIKCSATRQTWVSDYFPDVCMTMFTNWHSQFFRNKVQYVLNLSFCVINLLSIKTYYSLALTCSISCSGLLKQLRKHGLIVISILNYYNYRYKVKVKKCGFLFGFWWPSVLCTITKKHFLLDPLPV